MVYYFKLGILEKKSHEEKRKENSIDLAYIAHVSVLTNPVYIHMRKFKNGSTSLFCSI